MSKVIVLMAFIGMFGRLYFGTNPERLVSFYLFWYTGKSFNPTKFSLVVARILGFLIAFIFAGAIITC
jgi:tetrahydromethanopterin S-methyltransferase subunit F